MKASPLLRATLVVIALLCVPATVLAKRNLADYPMRVLIYQTHWNQDRLGFHAFGRANLFDEKGVPHGVEFTYDCMDHLMASDGNEAYPAKWKRQGQSVELIFGEIGAGPGSFQSCEMKIAEKSYVFFHDRGELGTESAAEFAAKHQKQAPSAGPATDADVPMTGKASNY